jgi:hypothetical protein
MAALMGTLVKAARPRSPTLLPMGACQFRLLLKLFYLDGGGW